MLKETIVNKLKFNFNAKQEKIRKEEKQRSYNVKIDSRRKQIAGNVDPEELNEIRQDLTHKIEDVEDKFSWNFLSTTAVGDSVILPSDFNEAKVIIKKIQI